MSLTKSYLEAGKRGFEFPNWGDQVRFETDDDQDGVTSKQIVVVLGWADELNGLSKV
jgi:hypothetical protein